MDALSRQMLATALGGTGTVLRRGSAGDEVAALQAFLAGRGYDVGNVDGDFGRQTERALKQFQLESGITQDGRAGKETYAAIERAQQPAPIPEMQADYIPPEAAGTPTAGYDVPALPQAAGTPTAGYEPELTNEQWLDATELGWGVEPMKRKALVEAVANADIPSDVPTPVTPEGMAAADLAERLPVPSMEPMPETAGEFQRNNPRFNPSNRVFQSVVGNPEAGGLEGEDALKAAMLRAILRQQPVAYR